MRQCVVCDHPDREAIERRIRRSEPLRDIAERYEVTLSTVYRHKSNHMDAPKIKPERQEKKEKEPKEAEKAPTETTETKPTETEQAIETDAVPIETDAVPIETDTQVIVGGLSAYQDLQALKVRAKRLLDETEEGTVFERAVAMREMRETIKSLVSTYETQRKIEAEYAPKNTWEQSAVMKFIKERHPEVIAELLEEFGAR